MAVATFTYQNVLEVVECCKCHMDFAMPRDKVDELRKNHTTFYCPVGHHLHFSGKSDEEKLRAQLAAAEGEITATRAQRDRVARRLEEQREETRAEKRRSAALRGHLTRMRNRIAAGVCPVPGCKRTNLRQTLKHIGDKHPEWLAQHGHELVEA